MTYQVSEIRPAGAGSLVKALFSHVWTARNRLAPRGPQGISRLSDRMLLDIGIDPRSVPNPRAQAIGNLGLLPFGHEIAPYRTTARS